MNHAESNRLAGKSSASQMTPYSPYTTMAATAVHSLNGRLPLDQDECVRVSSTTPQSRDRRRRHERGSTYPLTQPAATPNTHSHSRWLAVEETFPSQWLDIQQQRRRHGSPQISQPSQRHSVRVCVCMPDTACLCAHASLSVCERLVYVIAGVSGVSDVVCAHFPCHFL